QTPLGRRQSNPRSAANRPKPTYCRLRLTDCSVSLPALFHCPLCFTDCSKMTTASPKMRGVFFCAQPVALYPFEDSLHQNNFQPLNPADQPGPPPARLSAIRNSCLLMSTHA